MRAGQSDRSQEGGVGMVSEHCVSSHRLQVHLQKINNCGVSVPQLWSSVLRGDCGRKLSYSVLGMKTTLLAHLHIVEWMSRTPFFACFLLTRYRTNYGIHKHKNFLGSSMGGFSTPRPYTPKKIFCLLRNKA